MLRLLLIGVVMSGAGLNEAGSKLLRGELLDKGVGHFCESVLVNRLVERLEFPERRSGILVLFRLPFLGGCFEDTTVLV